jgi:hypothetical protein
MRDLLVGALAAAVISGSVAAAESRRVSPASLSKSDTVVVLSQNAPLQLETKVVARLARGQRLPVLQVSTTREGKWLWTESRGVKGWVNCDHVGRLSAGGGRLDSATVSHYPSIEYADPFGDTTTLFAVPAYDVETETTEIQYRNYNLPWGQYPDLD